MRKNFITNIVAFAVIVTFTVQDLLEIAKEFIESTQEESDEINEAGTEGGRTLSGEEEEEELEKHVYQLWFAIYGVQVLILILFVVFTIIARFFKLQWNKY